MDTYTLVFYLVIIVGVTYFLMIRPQQKQRKERETLLNNLKVRDQIITTGGIYGKITKIKDNSVMIDIAENVSIEVSKSGVATVESRDVFAEASEKA